MCFRQGSSDIDIATSIMNPHTNVVPEWAAKCGIPQDNITHYPWYIISY